MAKTTSCARSRACSLTIARLTWVRTVSGLTTSASAISPFDIPVATQPRISRSRSVRSPIRGCGLSARLAPKWSITVRVTDAADPTQTATKQLSITVDRGVTNLAVDPILLDVRSGLLGTKITVGVVHATLTGGNPGVPIAGQTIIFTVNGTPVCSGTTDAQGEVLCTMSVTNTLIATLAGKVSAAYAGNARWLPSSGSNGLIAT